MKSIKKSKLVLFILFIAALSRFMGLGSYPGGINVDEAYAGYEAWSLLNYGTDSWGVHNPVYLTVWGSGMSVLNTVLMIPFIKAMGLSILAIRLPQAIVGVTSVFVFYRLLKIILDEKKAIIGMFLFAVCPWHIMMSRFALDCNLVIGFMLLAVLFWFKGLDNGKWLILSGVFWGISLYCYAEIWIVVPILLVVWTVYSVYYKKIGFSQPIIAAALVLAVIALPLIVFCFVNFDILPPIYTNIISIPKLVQFRSDELLNTDVAEKILSFTKMLIKQNDGLIWNSTSYFGMFYMFSLPFIILGLICNVKAVINNFKNKKFGFEFYILSWCIISFIVSSLQGANINQANNICIPVIVLWTQGVSYIIEKVKPKFVKSGVIAAYIISFVCFEAYYYTDYQTIISQRQLSGTLQALEKADELCQNSMYDKIYITNSLRHSQVLFYMQFPTDKFINTVEWDNYPDKYLQTKSFGEYEWITIEDDCDSLPSNSIYIIDSNRAELFEKLGCKVGIYEYVGLAVKGD